MAAGISIETRLNLVIRLLSLVFLLFGVVLGFFTSSAPLVPQITPVFYTISALLIITGSVGLLARLH